ncbi:MAG: hypothetical protein R3F29_11060 [Planctomycetota bacterium]
MCRSYRVRYLQSGLTLLLVLLVHLATGLQAWTGVGLLADDHELIGGAILRHRGDWTLAAAFLPNPDPGAVRALYRPFVDLLFWLEQPWFGIEPLGYHVVNSAMHCGTALLWAVLVRRWSGSAFAGLATALLFVGWPGHSEVTHWIAARTTVQSVFLMSLSLLVHELAFAGERRAAARWLYLAVAGAIAAMAIGAKESAVFVLPLAGMIAWLRRERLLSGALHTLPMLVAVFGWLAWRAHCLGTWGSGTGYGWQATRIDAATCFDWLRLVLVPVHTGYASAWWIAVLAPLHGAALLAAWRLRAQPQARRVLCIGMTLVLCGYLAGIGLERMFIDVLQGARYGYEPALGLAAVLAVAVASLPPGWRRLALAGTVVVHAAVLDRNREAWLGAARVYRNMQAAVQQQAATSGAPVLVLDAPGVHEGAFAYLNSYTEFLFWQQTAPPGLALRGAVISTQDWRRSLEVLASAAAAKAPFAAQQVRWDDGGLAPLELDAQWPATPAAEVRIGYARIARQRPFAGTRIPIDVLLTTQVPLTLRLEGLDAAPLSVERSETAQALQLWGALPDDARDSGTITLVVEGPFGVVRHALGAVTPGVR